MLLRALFCRSLCSIWKLIEFYRFWCNLSQFHIRSLLVSQFNLKWIFSPSWQVWRVFVQLHKSERVFFSALRLKLTLFVISVATARKQESQFWESKNSTANGSVSVSISLGDLGIFLSLGWLILQLKFPSLICYFDCFLSAWVLLCRPVSGAERLLEGSYSFVAKLWKLKVLKKSS